VSGLLVLQLMSGLGLVGFIDDYLGIRFQRNLGLNKRAKSAGQLFVAIAFVLLCIHWVDGVSTNLSFARALDVELGAWGWGIWAILIIIGFQVILIGLVADVLAANRKLLEEVVYRLRRRDAADPDSTVAREDA